MKKYLLNLSFIIFTLNKKEPDLFSSSKILDYDINQKYYHSQPILPYRKKKEIQNSKKAYKEVLKQDKIIHPFQKNNFNLSKGEKPLKIKRLNTEKLPNYPKLIENTHFWYLTNKNQRNKKNKLKTEIEKEEIFNANFNPNLMISFTLYFFFALTSFYSIFFSFKSKRIFMAILSYTCSYYLFLFISTSINFSENHQVLVQILVFLLTIIFGLIFIIFTYKTNFFKFIIFGFSIASAISLIIAQFFIDFNEKDDLVMLFSVYFLLTITSCIICFFYYDKILLFFSSLVHSCIFVFNISVIFGKIISFENRKVFEKDGIFGVYVIVISVITLFGFFSQYFMKKKKNIMKEMEMNFDDDFKY